ncbi:DUF1028 domain-containing protein [Sphingobium sp.]|uniref:DUF1028 domain-containing protein n=1 Tax=Sphingobium sp. TaxID=1912891 RepID=UPI0026219306|nr:DUF1028 domain-containing protein [Sphingobium sp.]
MTYSLAARDPQTGMFGIAVASASIAVGNRCAWAAAGAGAITTQNRTDIRVGPRGLALLSEGRTAQQVVDQLVAESSHPEQRQFAAVDAKGATAFFSGPGIESINAAFQGEYCVSTGNTLANTAIPKAMVQAYEAAAALPFADRLLTALEAGRDAGGETKPAMAAGLRIVDKHSWPLVDLRIDYQEDPHGALRALWRTYEPLVDRFVAQVLTPWEVKPRTAMT